MEKKIEFLHAPDYRSIVYKGKMYTLTSLAAQAVQLLHELHKNGTPEVGKDYILEEIGSSSKRLRDIFQSCPDWKDFIIPGERKGNYRLNLS